MSHASGAVRTVWLDASLLMVGNLRQPAGVLRTSARLFRGLWAHGATNFRLCEIDLARGGFTEVPAARLLARFSAAEPAPADAPSAGGRSLWRAVGRRCLPRRARAALHALAQAGARLTRRALTRPRAAPLLDLGEGDLLLHLGGGWTYPGSGALLDGLRRRGLRIAHLVYDLIPVLQPQFFPPGMAEAFHDYLAPAIGHSGLLLAISEHTRRDLGVYAAQHGLALPPVEVIRLGDDPPGGGGAAPAVAGLGPGRPFVLAVGTVEVRKNHHLLYHLWRRLAARHGERLPPLVLVGVQGWLASDLVHQMRTDPLTRGTILHLTGCEDRVLRGLYRHCLFTLYPSHYEGWGLPVAEALAHGKAVVCSDTSSLPEIAPHLCVLRDPLDLPAWQAAVERLLFEGGAREALEARARREFRPTEWDQTAAECVAAVERHFGPAFRLPAGRARSA